jgi:hypothetical protein
VGTATHENEDCEHYEYRFHLHAITFE